MANHPKKMAGPTKAALSAIQEALNVREDEQPASTTTEQPNLFSAEEAQPVAAGDQEQTDKAATSARDLPDLAARAANDDQQSIGQILQALQRRPARSSYFVA